MYSGSGVSFLAGADLLLAAFLPVVFADDSLTVVSRPCVSLPLMRFSISFINSLSDAGMLNDIVGCSLICSSPFNGGLDCLKSVTALRNLETNQVLIMCQGNIYKFLFIS